MNPKTQSVCTCKVVSPRQVEDGECLICGKPFEPVSEPASTGEPPCECGERNCICRYLDRAARPSEPSAPQTNLMHRSFDYEGETLASKRPAPQTSTELPKCLRCDAKECSHGKCPNCDRRCRKCSAPQPVSGDAPTCNEVIRHLENCEKCSSSAVPSPTPSVSTERTDGLSKLLEVLGAIESVSGDDFCADLEMRNANRKLHGALATAYEKLGQIYRLSHGFNTQNSCHYGAPQAEPPK